MTTKKSKSTKKQNSDEIINTQVGDAVEFFPNQNEKGYYATNVVVID